MQNILSGTASATGENFFPALAKNLAKALDVPYVFVWEKINDPIPRLRSLAFWSTDRFVNNFEADLENTPCNTVLESQQLCYYPQDLQQYFPNNPLLEQLDAESYISAPLFDVDQNVIGNLSIVDVKPLQTDK